jgi:hypothetical protein
MQLAAGDTLDANERAVDFDHSAQHKRTVDVYSSVQFTSPG